MRDIANDIQMALCESGCYAFKQGIHLAFQLKTWVIISVILIFTWSQIFQVFTGIYSIFCSQLFLKR